MSPILYYILSGILSAAVLAGLSMQSKVKSAARGNLICVGVMGLAILLTLVNGGIKEALLNPYLWLAMAAGAAIGLFWASRVKMIEMPQVVALLNGIGGLASALVGAIELVREGSTAFANITAALALVIGAVTASGSLIAALKLARKIDGRPKVLPHHDKITYALLGVCVLGILLAAFGVTGVAVVLCAVAALLFGWAFAMRVGGADMPVAISLLNSLSGVAGAIAGMAISNVLLVAVGGIVGSSGLLLTQIMCKAMNRNLADILLGKTAKAAPAKKAGEGGEKKEDTPKKENVLKKAAAPVPEKQKAEKAKAEKPRAERIREDDAELLEMERIAEEAEAKAKAEALVSGAAKAAEEIPADPDVFAADAEGLDWDAAEETAEIAEEAADLKEEAAEESAAPEETASDQAAEAEEAAEAAAEDMAEAAAETAEPAAEDAAEPEAEEAPFALKDAKDVIIVPGYGMALSQAQHKVYELAEKLKANGARVRFAIHPVAGRMPGHMNVLLAEADVDYDDLFQLDEINDDFKNADAVVVVGASDVMNPAAREAEGTPIYGMPILNVDEAPHVFVCNFDLRPGYAGVENPLYSRKKGIRILLGDAKESLDTLISELK